MALTIENSCDQPRVSPKEYLSYLDRNIDPRDTAGIIESAPMFATIADDERLLTENLNAYLAGFIESGAQAELGNQSFLIGVNGCYILRCNIWLPLEEAELSADQERLEKEVYFFEKPHDHNFDFLTVGYFGGGYRTRIFEYNRRQVEGFPGEKVQARFLEETTLPAKKVMMYRAMQDIHTQYIPDELSISINLLVDNPELRLEPQYVFNSNVDRIESLVPQTRLSTKCSLIPIAGLIGDQNTAQLLEDICLSSSLPDLMRTEALNALGVLSGTAAATDTLQKMQVDTKGGIFKHSIAIGDCK
ncbi:hypothetical protein [Congregibacter litoralis]|uniref:Uncharacterized protein n=1 Tax=Congregibacter litoralis KT71 TaxID=314285 RepID=A4A8G1_9GAMM|nr:hypothetical protein [Congregibacter litoralis]EAQ97956.1 hypothetical protein KT71_15364 [Congregibacter litoralis KT71]